MIATQVRPIRQSVVNTMVTNLTWGPSTNAATAWEWDFNADGWYWTIPSAPVQEPTWPRKKASPYFDWLRERAERRLAKRHAYYASPDYTALGFPQHWQPAGHLRW